MYSCRPGDTACMNWCAKGPRRSGARECRRDCVGERACRPLVPAAAAAGALASMLVGWESESMPAFDFVGLEWASPTSLFGLI